MAVPPHTPRNLRRLAGPAGAEYHLRSQDELAAAFTGLELVEPGLAQITAWHAEGEPEQTDAYGAVARKP